MGKSRYTFSDLRKPHFITCTAIAWLPVFAKPEAAAVVLDSLRHLSQNGVKIYAYVIMENHLHLAAQSETLDRDIAAFKSYSAKRIIAVLRETSGDKILAQMVFAKKTHKNDREHQFWEEGAHPVCLDGEKIFAGRVNYIHQNPVRRGYVDEAAHWRYSSARNYLGQRGLLDVCTEW